MRANGSKKKAKLNASGCEQVKRTKITPQFRRAELERRLREQDWDGDLVAGLAKKWGCSPATIYRDREAVLAELAKEQDESRPLRRAELLLRIRLRERQAARDRDHGSSLRALALEAKITGLEEADPIVVETEAIPEDALERMRMLYGDVHRLRRQCEASGKATAAMQAMKQEHELLGRISDEENRRASLDRATRSEADLLGELRDKLLRLPDLARDRLNE